MSIEQRNEEVVRTIESERCGRDERGSEDEGGEKTHGGLEEAQVGII